VDSTAGTELRAAGGFHSKSKKRARRADFTAKAEAARRVNFTAGAKGAAGGFHGKTEKWARQWSSTARQYGGAAGRSYGKSKK
jgi:hypothetical protein